MINFKILRVYLVFYTYLSMILNYEGILVFLHVFKISGITKEPKDLNEKAHLAHLTYVHLEENVP